MVSFTPLAVRLLRPTPSTALVVVRRDAVEFLVADTSLGPEVAASPRPVVAGGRVTGRRHATLLRILPTETGLGPVGPAAVVLRVGLRLPVPGRAPVRVAKRPPMPADILVRRPILARRRGVVPRRGGPGVAPTRILVPPPTPPPIPVGVARRPLPPRLGRRVPQTRRHVRRPDGPCLEMGLP